MYASVLKPLKVGSETELVESDNGDHEEVKVSVVAEPGEILDVSGWKGVQGYVEQGYLFLLPSDPDALERLAEAARDATKQVDADNDARTDRAKKKLREQTKGRKKVKRKAVDAGNAPADEQTDQSSVEDQSQGSDDVGEQGDGLGDMSVKELRKIATKLDIEGRSSLDKQGLIDAIRSKE